MDDRKISPEIVGLMSKQILPFVSYWFEHDIMSMCRNKEYFSEQELADYRYSIIQTITNGIQSIESNNIDVAAYLKMGMDHFKLGLTYEEMNNNRFLFESAMENFINMKRSLSECQVSDGAVQQYLKEFHLLNEKVLPILLEGYCLARDNEDLTYYQMKDFGLI